LPFVAVEDRKRLPKTPSIYFAINSQGSIQYIGKSMNPCQRWANHHRLGQVQECRIAYLICDAALLNEVEQALIEYFAPPLNNSRATNTPTRAVFYLPPELKTKLEALASKRNRSVSNLLETLAKDVVEQAEESGELPRD